MQRKAIMKMISIPMSGEEMILWSNAMLLRVLVKLKNREQVKNAFKLVSAVVKEVEIRWCGFGKGIFLYADEGLQMKLIEKATTGR